MYDDVIEAWDRLDHQRKACVRLIKHKGMHHIKDPQSLAAARQGFLNEQLKEKAELYNVLCTRLWTEVDGIYKTTI